MTRPQKQMKRTLFKSLAATGAAALLLSGCGLLGDDASGDDTGGDNDGGNAVYDAMTTWDACEVLDNLQPIADHIGIQGFGSSAGGEPSTAKIGNTWDPESIGCNNLIYLGSWRGFAVDGEIKVKIVPMEGETQAVTTYNDRVSIAEGRSAGGTDAQIEEFGDPWDDGTMISWVGAANANYVEVIGRDGQWVFHIDLNYSKDPGADSGEPILPVTSEEANRWFVDNYPPEVTQIVNDRIQEGQ